LVTEEELLDTLHNARQILFKDIYADFTGRYEHDKSFTTKIDSWKKTHEEDLKYDWLKLYKKDKNFRSQVDSVLAQYEKIPENWLDLYEDKEHNHARLKSRISSLLRENDIQTDWIDKLCSEGTYAFINRILFLRICEDRKFIKTKTTPEWIKILEASSFDDTVRNLLRELFGIVSEKFKFYSKPLFDHIALEEVVWKKTTIAEIIGQTRKYNFQKIDRDVIGAVYQKHISKDTRRRLGQFYTPPAIIQHILGQIPLKFDQKVIDPACGSGGFLLAIYDLLRKEMERTKWSDGNVHDHLIQKVIYGIDIDPFAQQLTIMNLILKDLDQPEYIVNVADGDSLKFGLDLYEEKKPIAQVSAKNSEYILTANDILREATYDAVVGNPPFVQIRKDNDLYKEEFAS
ncbi:MAG: HsdM family class I SAM-dependent methyltransferase, partial [Rhabdochlamydiaceae bacterium]